MILFLTTYSANNLFYLAV